MVNQRSMMTNNKNTSQNGYGGKYAFAAASLTAGSLLYLYMNTNKSLSMADEGKNEVEIDFAASLGNGEMKELSVGPKDGDKVLVSRVQGKLHAVGAFCTHFGFPLAKGLLFDDKVVCPLHGASFSVTTGALN